MSDYPTSTTPIRTIGRREVCYVNDGRSFSRKKGTQEWIELESQSSSMPPDSESLYLSLVHHSQGPGEPLHWSIFIARENQPDAVYQVMGDAEEHMNYKTAPWIDLTNTTSIFNLYQLATITDQQATMVKEIADSEFPLRAPNRQSVKENCQGWAVRVIAKLVDRGIVADTKLEMAT